LFIFTIYNTGDEIKDCEIGGGGQEIHRGEVHTGIWWRNLKTRHHLEDQYVYMMIILKGVLNMLFCSVECINVAHDRDKWRAVVNTVMNLQVS